MKFSTFNTILFSKQKTIQTVIALLCVNYLFAATIDEKVLKANSSIISSNAQCLSGNSFDFTSSSTISSGSISSYNWNFGDGKTATGNTVTHAYFSAGTFSVTLVVTSDNGCVDSISKTVTVYPQPLAAFSNPANQCLAGNNFNFISTASIPNSGSIVSQVWNFGDGNTATGLNVNHSYTSSGNYPVNLQVVSNNGCIDLITDTITVLQMPLVTIPQIAAICTGNTLSLNANASNGSNPYTYTWTGPNGFNASIKNPNINNASINANGTYTVNVVDSNSCSGSSSISILINQTPILSPIVGPAGGCVGSTITLTNSTAAGIWSSNNPSVASVNAVSGQINFLSIGTTNIQYTVSNAGCSSSVNSNLISNSVGMHPDVIECNNGITHFSATDIFYGVTYSNNNPSNTYLWSITGGPFSYQGSSNANSAYPNVQLQSGNAFTAIVQFTSNGITCSAKQMVYKLTSAADTIKGSHDTTVCNTTAPIPLSAAISPASNSFSWTSSGSGTFSNTTSLNTTYTPSVADKAAGILKIYFTATSTLNSTGNCGTAFGRDSMIIRIYPANMAANSSQTICSNQTIFFTPVSSIPGSFYSWSSSVVSGTVNGNSATGTGQINDSLVNANNSLDATVVYTITPFAFTPTNTTCTGNPFNYTVIIKPTPGITITNTNPNICTGSNTNIQFNSSTTGNLYTWTSNIISGAISGNSSNAVPSYNTIIHDSLSNSFNANSKIRYYIHSVSNAGCSNIDSTDVLVYAQPTKANAGIDQVLCNVSNSILSANIPGIGIGNWNQISGPSNLVFASQNSPFSSVTGLIPGNYLLEWSISNGNCNISRDTIQLINATETFGGTISSNNTVCAGQNSGNLVLTGYAGTIQGWEYSIDGGINWLPTAANTSNSYTYQNLTTSTRFRAIVQNGICSAVYSSVATITVNSPTIPGTLSSDSIVCISSNSGSINLSGFTGSIIRWESSTDAGANWPTIINNSTSNYNYTNLTTTTLFRAVIQNGTCNAVNSNAVTITVSDLSIPGSLTTDNIVCSNNNNGTLDLTGNNGNILNWESSINGGSNWLVISNNNNHQVYSNLTSTTIYRAKIQNAVCLPVYTNTVSITVLPIPTVANAGADQIICNQSAATLAANTAVSGSGNWTSIVGNPSPVNFVNATDPNTAITGLVAGTYQLVWTISNGICADSRDTVIIKVIPATIAGSLTADAIVCATANTNSLVVNSANGNVLQWESSLNLGANWDTIQNNNNTYTYTNLSSTTSFRAKIQNQICPALYTNMVTITVLPTVTKANAGIDQRLCNQTTASLAANHPISGTGNWTSIASNPSTAVFTNSNDPASTISGLVPGSYQFIWTISNQYCGDSKDTVQVIIFPSTIPGNLSADNFVCANSNTGNLVLSNNNGIILQWESSIDNGINWIPIAISTNTYTYNNLTTNTLFRVLVSNGNCSAIYSNTVKINLSPVSIPGNLVSNDTLVCSNYNSGKINLSGNNGTIVKWEFSEDEGATWNTISNATNELQFINLTKATIYRALIQSGVCSIAYSNSVKINVAIPTIPGIISGATFVCTKNNNGKIELTGNNGAVIHWEYSIDNGINWTTIADNSKGIQYQNLTQTTTYRALVQNSVCTIAYTNSITINTVQEVTMANAGPNQLICNSNTVTTIAANTAIVGSGIWSFINGPSELFFTDATQANTIVNGLKPGTYQLAWTIDNGVCPSSTSNLQIVVDKLKVNFNLNAINECGSTTYQFNDASTVYSGIANWKWSVAAGDTITTKNISKNYTQAGQNKISLTVQSNSGCSATTGANFQVKVFDMPKSSINAINEACKNQLLQATSSINSRDSIFSILWNLGNGINTKDSMVTVQYYSEGKYTIKLIVSTVNKCYDSSFKSITIRPLPIVTITSDNFVCKGDSIKLMPTGALTYIWMDKQNNIICNNCETLNIHPTNNAVYSVIGYDQYGCSQIASTTVKLVNPQKINAIQRDTICIGSSVQLNVTGADKYIWQSDDGLSNYRSGTTIASPKTNTTYTVIGKDNHACFADTAQIKIVVGNPTKINIGTDTTIQAGVPFRISATSYDRANILQWQWSGNAIFSCTDCATTMAKIANDGDVMLTAMNEYGCYSRDTISVKTFCPSTEIFIPNAFSPDGDGINDILYVQGSGIKTIKLFRIYSRWGELVYQRANFQPNDKSTGWDGKIRGKIASQDVFVYICEVLCDKGLAATFKGNIAVLK